MTKPDWVTYAEGLALVLEQQGCFEDEWLRKALFEVPRHLFIRRYYENWDAEQPRLLDRNALTDEDLKALYADDALLIRKPPKHSAASQPAIVFQMLGDLLLEPGHKVLEIGTGSGWNTALLAYRAGDDSLVYSTDIQPELVEEARAHLNAAGFGRLNLRTGDGGYGWAEAAPFDRIIVTVGAQDIPPAWVEQMSDNGILLQPIEMPGMGNPVLRLQKSNGRLQGKFTRGSDFYPLRGDFGLDVENEADPCPKSLIEELHRIEPKAIPLHAPASADFFFFLHITGTPVQQTRWATSLGHVVFDREFETAFFIALDQTLINVCGDPRPGERFVNRQEEWIRLGRPGVKDCQVELIRSRKCRLKPLEKLEKRPSVTLKLSLRVQPPEAGA